MWKAETPDVRLNTHATEDRESVTLPRMKSLTYGPGTRGKSVAYGQGTRDDRSTRMMILLMIAFVIVLLAAALAAVFAYLDSNSPGRTPEDVDELAVETDIYLDPEDLDEYTSNCTACDHMGIDGMAVADFTERFLEDGDYIYERDERNFWGYETVTVNDRTTKDVVYEWDESFYLNDSYDIYVWVYYDAVTDDMHNLNLKLPSEIAVSYLEQFFAGFYDVHSIEPAEFASMFDEGGNYYCKNVEIIVSPDDDELYYINLYPTNHPFRYMDDQPIEIQELSDAEAAEWGEACNAVGHMETLAADQTAVVETWLDTHGYSTYTFEMTSDNRLEVYPQLGGLTWAFTTFARYYTWTDSSSYLQVMIEADTCSDRIHRLSLDGFPKEALAQVLDLMTMICGKGEGLSLLDECLEKYENDGYAFVGVEDLEIYLTDSYCPEGTLSAEIYVR